MTSDVLSGQITAQNAVLDRSLNSLFNILPLATSSCTGSLPQRLPWGQLVF
jgi:hypothetical protein